MPIPLSAMPFNQKDDDKVDAGESVEQLKARLKELGWQTLKTRLMLLRTKDAKTNFEELEELKQLSQVYLLDGTLERKIPTNETKFDENVYAKKSLADFIRRLGRPEVAVLRDQDPVLIRRVAECKKWEIVGEPKCMKACGDESTIPNTYCCPEMPPQVKAPPSKGFVKSPAVKSPPLPAIP